MAKFGQLLAVATLAWVGLFAPHAIAGTVEEIIAADKAFSAMSEEKRVGPAFIAYSHDDIRYFPRGSEPLVGKKAVTEAFSSADQKAQDASGAKLVWEPTEGSASDDGSLGWTYGTWTYRSAPDASGNRKDVAKGNYVTVWKKDASGAWKMIADIGTRHEAPAQQ